MHGSPRLYSQKVTARDGKVHFLRSHRQLIFSSRLHASRPNGAVREGELQTSY